MIAVIIERERLEDHSYRIYGDFRDSRKLWHVLEQPALALIGRLKREHPALNFQATLQVVHSYVNDDFIPELTLTLLSANDPDLAQSLLQQFVDAHAHLISGEERER